MSKLIEDSTPHSCLTFLNSVQKSVIFKLMSHSTHTSPTATAPHNTGRDVALIAVFAAFIAVCALLPAFPVGPAGVPITFQTLGIYLTALVLGGKRGFLAVLLYVIVGLLGLPVFAGGSGGIAALAGPSAGYLLAFAPAAALTGALAYSTLSTTPGKSPILRLTGAVLAGFVLMTAAGIAGMVINAGISWPAAFTAALLYVPGDLIKCAVAIAVALPVHRAFPTLSRR